MAVRQVSDKILLYCHVGCSAEDVLDALGMTFSDLYPDDPMKAAYRAATANGGAKWERNMYARVQKIAKEYPRLTKLQAELKYSLQREDEMVLRIARADMERGHTLTFEDRARLDLAMERLRMAA